MVKINFFRACLELLQIFSLFEKLLIKILFFLIRIYQIFFAQILGFHNCRFMPSCSCYMQEAVTKKGLIKGVFLGVKRILKCHPFSKKNGYDPVK